ncbi:MAG: shikimate kinase, partial [Anaerolineae bacterium]
MRNEENLILTGFMGTGKTSVGREIAQRLGREFVDMDTLIETRTGLTVAEIFRQWGEAHFRRLEADLCRELAARSRLVIATGGGTLIPDLNRELLMASGIVVCLTASLDEILRRLERAEDRPLLHVPDRRERIAALLAERAAAYGRIPL